MFDAIRRQILRALLVPAEPHPPAGAPGSVRVFRAGQNFFRLKLAGWAVAQLVALAGALISLWFVGGLIDRTRGLKEATKAPPAAISQTNAPTSTVDASGPSATPSNTQAADASGSTTKAKAKRPRRNTTAQLAANTPDWVLIAIRLFEYGALAVFVLQIPWTFAALRLDFDLRWYIVTDRSLRLRSGLFFVHESTLSFVNIQQVVVTQGPLQRLLGMADVRVQSAGGGGGDHHGKGGTDETLHTAVFHAVDNAHEIRDLILARLRQFRAAGLGDPDDASPAAATAIAHASPTSTTKSDALAAARELLDEARALRGALAR